MNRYPFWKYMLILTVLGIGALYALPNLYQKDPAVQITKKRAELTSADAESMKLALEAENIGVKSAAAVDGNVLVRLLDADQQSAASEALKNRFDDSHTVAFNLANTTPAWLEALGGTPMVLGLDLQGGVHFLMQVDMETARANRIQIYAEDIRQLMRTNRVSGVTVSHSDTRISLKFRDSAVKESVRALIDEEIPELQEIGGDDSTLRLQIAEIKLAELESQALEQNVTALRNRVDAMGVAEPLVQQQGADRIVIQLPGVQDTAEAKRLLGSTATLEYYPQDTEHNGFEAARTGVIPAGTKLYYRRTGEPVLLKRSLIVKGDQLVDAISSRDQQTGEPQVSVTLNNIGGKRMLEFTRNNVDRPMAVVYKETTPEIRENESGEPEIIFNTTEEVISIANINEPFGKRFRTTGLDPAEATELALLLRAGALAAPVAIIEERTVGPSLGRDLIEKGFQSVAIGFVIVLILMAVYYRVFGLVANLALLANMVMIVALLSLLGATLTMPGIAGIVLTVGMAVDANVLIFERIREELRLGNSPQASIRSGYDKAFSTIFDANITTLIAALVLFAFGTGPIKGFAITLSLGIATSMFTAIMGTRAVINLIYGRQARIAKLAI